MPPCRYERFQVVNNQAGGPVRAVVGMPSQVRLKSTSLSSQHGTLTPCHNSCVHTSGKAACHVLQSATTE